MSRRTVTVSAPSRLHFGMLSFGQPGERQFGGAGAMLDQPGLKLRIAPSTHFQVNGLLGDRVRAFATAVFSRLELHQEPTCRLEVVAAPPEHVGLGVGTQLGLSVAAGLNAFLGRSPLGPKELAQLSKRGERSAIGTYGFSQGGLLVEAGKLPGESLSPLVARVAIPSHWRWVLMIARNEHGLSGIDEREAFREVPPVPLQTTAELCLEALSHLLPAASEGNFAEFGGSLFRYGYAAGMCFAKFQHGAYSSERVTKLVNTVRRLGIDGVGQSSWGPTLYALVADERQAQSLVKDVRSTEIGDGLDFVIAAPNNAGAKIETE